MKNIIVNLANQGSCRICRRFCYRTIRSRIFFSLFILTWIGIIFFISPVSDVNNLAKRYETLNKNDVNEKQKIIQLKTRIEELEKLLQNKYNEAKTTNTNTMKNKISTLQKITLPTNSKNNCIIVDPNNSFPDCNGKMNWMRLHWKSDPCYAEHGVDGTDCSFQRYLSEVEWFCPLLPGRVRISANNSYMNNDKLKWNLDYDGLINLLENSNSRRTLEWIKNRVKSMWPNWFKAGKGLSEKTDQSDAMQFKILLHLGLLTKQSNFNIAELQFKGGPLGELVQWADIISLLYVLGHKLLISTEINKLQQILGGPGTKYSSCPAIPGKKTNEVDIIYTDIAGLKQIKRILKNGFGQISCKLRIIDSFGTEPAYNFERYARSHKGMRSTWGMHNLNPRQFFTMFPHSDDNSFMGFVVLSPQSNNSNIVKKNQALVYGKHENYWANVVKYIEVFKKYLDVHGTVYIVNKPSKFVPNWIINHGLLNYTELSHLLLESKIFIGLGFPYEGPSPLEAIAAGVVFIQPKFKPPHSSLNRKFFQGKPTSRQLSSQHPYVEEFIGEPHVFTVDINDNAALESTIKKALDAHESGKLYPYLPNEFTAEGMMERVSIYLKHQDFCSPSAYRWPPDSVVQLLMAEPGQSCSELCRQNGRICEPTHFDRLNSKHAIEKLINQKCTAIKRHEDIYYPAFERETNHCWLQEAPLLFSCVGSRPEFVRLCPCRDFIKGQVALCSKCL